MAETPETPENENENAVPADLVEEVETAASPEGAGEPTTVDADTLEQAAPTSDAAASAPAGPPPGGTRRERLDARRQTRRAAAAGRGPRTLEERIAEREARRETNARQRRAYRAKQKAKRAEARASAPEPEIQHAPEHGPGRPKVRQGVVTSDKADKTITVRIDIVRRHKRYRKIMRSSMTLHAHDERNTAGSGDTVRVVETRPMSRTKRWRLLDVVERAR